MDVKKKGAGCMQQCCKMVSMVSIDERGQMVLPKELRDKAGIGAGDKMAIVTWENNDKVSCIGLIKADDMGSMISDFLGPIMGRS